MVILGPGPGGGTPEPPEPERRDLSDRPPVRIGSIEFNYSQPYVSKSGGINTKEHDLLPTGNDDHPDNIIQSLGSQIKDIEVVGVCTLTEANQLDDLDEGQRLTMRSYRYSGPAVLIDYDTSPYGNSRGGHAKDRDYDQFLYDMTIQLQQIRNSLGEGDFIETT